MEKTCSICDQTKPTSEYEVGTSVGGVVTSYKSYCKVCSYAKRNDRMAAAPKQDPASVPKPLECRQCKKGPDEVKFQWRRGVRIGSWRQPCYACLNAKGHSQKYRERQRAEDEAGYLQHNAEVHLAWAHANPDKVKEQQRLTRVEADRKVKIIRTSAAQREIRFEEADLAAMTAKLCGACSYCGYTPVPGEELNGLDRVDNRGDYSDANTVTACGACNGMKGVHTVGVFAGNVRRIVAHRGLATPSLAGGDTERPKPPPALSGSTEARQAAAKKQKLELLPDDVKVRLWASPCYLCGRAPALGIDRMDSDGDYADGNVQPCCSDCNYLKKHHTVAQLEAHLPYIAERMASLELPDTVDNEPMFIMGGKQRHAVRATFLDGSGSVVFPSIATAASIIGVSDNAINCALDDAGRTCRECRWVSVEPRDYRRQAVPSEQIEQAIMKLRMRKRARGN